MRLALFNGVYSLWLKKKKGEMVRINICAVGQWQMSRSMSFLICFTVFLISINLSSVLIYAEEWIVGSDGDDWVENTTFDSTTVKYDNAELLNGYNPMQLFWVTSGGTNAGSLDAEDKKHCQRFTALFNKTVNRIGLYWKYGGISSANYKAGIQKDNGGYPDGNWVNSNGFGVVYPSVGDNWYFVLLNNPVDLVKGEIYHIVVEWDSGTIDATSEIYLTVPSTDVIPYNSIGPDKNINIIDSNLYMTTYSDAGGWEILDKGVMTFLLDFNDDTYYGQPWCHGYEWCGDRSYNYYREVIKITLQDKTVETIGTMMGVRPTDWSGGASEENWAALTDCQYEICVNETTVLRNGTLCTGEQVRDQYENFTYWPWDRRFAWYETNLSSPLTLEKDKTYYVYFFAPGLTDPTPIYLVDTFTGRDNFHPLYPYEGPNPLAITTWDGIDSYFERWSSSSGSIWKDDGKTRDVSLKFKLVDVYEGNLTSITKDAESIGSAGDVWKQISFDGTVPVSTDVAIYINSSLDNSAWTGWILLTENTVSGTYYELSEINKQRYAKWRLVLNTNNSTITPQIERVIFRTTLDKILVYPNPHKGDQSWPERITFGNLPADATIRIYTLSGDLVETIKHQAETEGGIEEWDISDIASGVYIYSVKSASGKKVGRVCIIK